MTQKINPINENESARFLIPFQRPWREALRIYLRRLFFLLGAAWIGLIFLALFTFVTIYPKFSLAFPPHIVTYVSLAVFVVFIAWVFLILFYINRSLVRQKGTYLSTIILVCLTVALVATTTLGEDQIHTASANFWNQLDQIKTPDNPSQISTPFHIAQVITATPTPTRTPTAPPTNVPSPTFTALPTASPTKAPLILIPTDTPISPTPAPLAVVTLAATPTFTLPPETTATATLEPPSPTPLPAPTDPPTPTATATQPAASLANLAGTIAYSILGGNNPGVYLYRFSTQQSTRLIPNARQPDLNPAGSIIARSGNGALIRISIDGSNLHPVTTQAEDAHPHWSIAGDAYVYDSSTSFNQAPTIYLQSNANLNQNGKLLTDPAGNPLNGQFPIYLANGRIAYKGCDHWAGNSNCGIYTIEQNGKNAVQISSDTSDTPTDNLDSQVLFMTHRAGNWDIYIADPMVHDQPRPINTDPSNDGLPAASPDGQFIAFLSDRPGNGQWAIYVMGVNGSAPQKLFDINGSYGPGDLDWTQDHLSWSQAN